MAFPVPAHLPRKAAPQDVSTQILSKIDAATTKTLNSALATSWVQELDQTIQATKEKIHERVQRDLPTFERQLASAKSVQERLQTLKTHVETLKLAVTGPEEGLIPTLVEKLTRHAELEQQALDASVSFDALFRLKQLKSTFESLESLVKEGKLAEAVVACRELDGLIQETPLYLNETTVIRDLRAKFRATQSRNDEQLSNACLRGLVISQNELSVSPMVQVRKSTTWIGLLAVLHSLSGVLLSNHLTIVRRDLTTHFIEHLLKYSITISSSSTGDKQSLILSPSRDEDPSTRIRNLSVVFTFLSRHFFTLLPPSERNSFPRSLCKPTTTSLLNNILVPSLPKSFDGLPKFLDLVKECVAFEEGYVGNILGGDPNDRPIKAWAEGLSGHYERQRRFLILDHARDVIVAKDGHSDTFVVEVEVIPDAEAPLPTASPTVQESEPIPNGTQDISGAREDIYVAKDDAWGFDDGLDTGNADSFAAEEDSWGFDEDTPEPEAEAEPESEVDPKPLESASTQHPSPNGSASTPELVNADDEPDPSEAWGWNEDDNNEEPTEETAWDDPWADEPATTVESRPPPAPSIPPASAPPTPSPAPKAATRLEKAANKGKKHLNGTASTSVLSPEVPSSPYPHQHRPANNFSESLPQPVVPPPVPRKKAIPVKESYAVSSRTKQIISLVEHVLNEGKQFTSSKLISPSSSSSTQSGNTILLSAPSILDLYRALYPVKAAAHLAPRDGLRFSNDCLYLTGEVERIRQGLPADVAEVVRDRLGESTRYFSVLSESWYHDTIYEYQQYINKIIGTGAQGFTFTGDQDRYDECEAAVMEALQEVRRFSHGVKDVLTKSKYYTSLGLVVNTALSKILFDVLALHDIPEVESHRLSELCKILHAVEGLFVEDPEQPSFIAAYVPSWLKYSYLSELLEASLADITYLFEVGALVDFQIDEIVSLVRALFSDTPLRTNTINKLLEGHPIPS